MKIRTAQFDHSCYTMRFLHLNIDTKSARYRFCRLLHFAADLQHFAAESCCKSAAVVHFEGETRCCRTKFLCSSSDKQQLLQAAAATSCHKQHLVAHCGILRRKCAANSVTAADFEGKIACSGAFFSRRRRHRHCCNPQMTGVLPLICFKV